MDIKLTAKTINEEDKTLPDTWNYKNTYFMLTRILFTISGFIVAIAVNILFPQKADVEFKTYYLNTGNLTFGFNMNSAYIVVLLGLILIYGSSGIVSLFKKERRKLYAKNAAFRAFLGIALAIWDIGGTKLQVFAQLFSRDLLR